MVFGITEISMTEPAYPLTSPETWPDQGAWTYEDYLRLPDDGQRYEIIRGILYVSPAPTLEHQFTVVRLVRFLDVFVSRRKLGLVLVAPFDVRLPQRIADPVQPDVLFFRKGNEPRTSDEPCVPDLVIEVLSPKTRRLDEKVKLAAYRDAGVPEVWLADPLSRSVRVHQLKDGAYPEADRYGSGETVRSAVLPGLQVKIDKIFY
jgi:Uma2 family endonuclease